jgi:hypothetical protein
MHKDNCCINPNVSRVLEWQGRYTYEEVIKCSNCGLTCMSNSYDDFYKLATEKQAYLRKHHQCCDYPDIRRDHDDKDIDRHRCYDCKKITHKDRDGVVHIQQTREEFMQELNNEFEAIMKKLETILDDIVSKYNRGDDLKEEVDIFYRTFSFFHKDQGLYFRVKYLEKHPKAWKNCLQFVFDYRENSMWEFVERSNKANKLVEFW